MLINEVIQPIVHKAEQSIYDKTGLTVKMQVVVVVQEPTVHPVISNQEIEEYIIKAVCLTTGVIEKQIFSKVRTEPVVDARNIVMYLMSVHLQLNPSDIAQKFKKRTHSYASHGLKRHKDRVKHYPPYCKMLERVINTYNELLKLHGTNSDEIH